MTIDIIYKGKILGTCDVIIFTTAEPDILSYEMRDNIANFHKNTWVSNFKPIEDTGGFDISKYKLISADVGHSIVADLLKLLTERYASISYQYYAQEITRGTH